MTKKDYYDFREEDNTRQVKLVLLLREAFKKWKIILLAGIVLGMLFGGYKILSIRMNKASMIEDYEAYRDKLNAYKQSQEDYRQTVAELQKSIADKKDYYSNSALMKLNPYSMAVCSVNLNISSTDKVKLTDAQINTIRASISNEILLGDTIINAAKKAGISTEDFRDLTTTTTSSGNSIVRVVVRGETIEEASQRMDYILEGVEAKHKLFTKNVGEFVCTPYNLSATMVPDDTIAKAQDKFTESLTKLETAAYTAQNQSSQLSKPDSVPEYSKKYMLKNGIKMGIVGFAGGIILAVVALIALAIAKGTIFTSDEIDGEFGLVNLADLQGRDLNAETGRMDYILAQLENALGKGAVIGLTGQAEEKNRAALLEALSRRSRETGSSFKFEMIGNLLTDASALRRLKDLGGVILVEQIGSSDYMDARREIAVLAGSSSNILGTVYF